MQLRLHAPSSIDTSGDLSPLQRARLQQVIARAFARAVGTLDLPSVRIELVSAAETEATNTNVQLEQVQGDTKERVGAARVRDGTDYKVPSYDSGGRSVDIPVKETIGTAKGDTKERVDVARVRDGTDYKVPSYDSDTTGEPSGQAQIERDFVNSTSTKIRFIGSFDSGSRPVSIPVNALEKAPIGTAEGDTIDLGEFPHIAVIQGSGNSYIYIGGSPYVKAKNLAYAMQWGAYLFGGSGYAVLQPKGASPDGPFYVAHLLDSVKLKGETEAVVLESGERAVGVDARMIHLQDYLTVAVMDGSGNLLFGNRLNDPWNLAMYKRGLAHVPKDQRTIEKSSVQKVSNLLLSRAARTGGDAGMVEMIVKMDRTLFAAMPWEKRVEYLVLLLDVWTNEREEIAILEIIHATHSESELEAIFALLRERGKYEKLFDDLDGRVFDLLQMLGEYRTGRPLDWHYLVDLFISMNFMPSAVQDPERELERLAGGLLDWLQSTWEGIRFLFTKPDEVLEGLGHLAELLWTVQKAQDGDPQAQAFITLMVIQACAATAKAIRGLQYAEELGTPYGHRGGGTGIGGDILGRLRAAILFEVLSWFIGIGEIRAAIRAAGTLPERLAALMEVLRSLRLLGRIAEAGTDAAKLERVLIALAHLAEVGEEARILRLAEFLPQEHLALLERIAQSVELPQGAEINALRTVLHGKTELLKEVDQLGDSLNVIGRVEARASSAGGMTAEMTKGLHALLQHTGWKRTTMISLIEDIPAANLPEFLYAMTFVKPVYLQRWGLQALKDLAARPRVLTFIREAGSDLLEVAFGHTDRSWEKFEIFLDGLAIERNRIGNAAEYQRLLDRLGRGESSAFDQVAVAAHAQSSTEEGILHRLLEEAAPTTNLPTTAATQATERVRAFNPRFSREQLNKILSNYEHHPLKFLVDPETKTWRGTSHLSTEPAVQIGHLTSLHSGAPERLALEDAFFNQVSNWRGEQQGAIFYKEAVDIGGVPVEKRTAQMYENLGLLPEGTVANAPPHPGWSPP